MTRPLDDEMLARLLALGAGSDEDDAAPPVDLGRYRVIRELGRGGMGVVYEAEDPTLQRTIALKVLAESAGPSPTLRERFAREALAAARLRHPNIATIHEATPDYIAMQLVDGIPLGEFASDPRTLVSLLATAADAVHAAHTAGIVHRDLKPSNFMIERPDSESPHLYVLDFGLAKETAVDSSLSVTGHLLGTPAYMAPEQARGDPREVDERTDVYGLGATLYAVLAQTPPFPGDDLVRVLSAVSADLPRPLRRVARSTDGGKPNVDRDLETIVHKAMAKEKRERYDTAAEFAADLRRWLRSEPIRARRPSFAYRLRTFARRRSGPLKAAAVAASVTAVAAIWFLASERAARTGTEDALRLSNRVDALVQDADDAFRSGHLSVYREKLREAVMLCRRSLARRGVAQGHFLLGRLQFRRQEYKSAIDALDRALALDPTLDEARFLRGLVLLRYAAQPPEMGGPISLVSGHLLEQARKDLRVHERSRLSFRRVDVLYGEARLALLDGGDLAVARRNLETIVHRLDPTHVQAIRALAELVGETDEAAARELSARAVDLERGVGLAAALGAKEAVVPDETELTVPIRSPDTHTPAARADTALRRARAARLRGRIEDAITAWRAAIAIGGEAVAAAPDDPAPLNNRGAARAELSRILAAQGRAFAASTERMRAIADFTRALELGPCPFARFNRAEARSRHADQLDATGMGDAAARCTAAALADYRLAVQEIPPASPYRDRVVAAWRTRERGARE